MATAHLLFGGPGAGKTTLARRLEAEHRALRFTPDEWMVRLFGEDPPAAIFADRAAAILGLMQPLWRRALALGVDVVLDYGFWRRAERDAVRELVRQAGGRALLYRLDTPAGEAWRRVEGRNAAPERSLHIARPTFEALRARIETLEADEDRVDVGEGMS